MASYLLAMASNPIAMASCLIAMASNLIANKIKSEHERLQNEVLQLFRWRQEDPNA